MDYRQNQKPVNVVYDYERRARGQIVEHPAMVTLGLVLMALGIVSRIVRWFPLTIVVLIGGVVYFTYLTVLRVRVQRALFGGSDFRVVGESIEPDQGRAVAAFTGASGAERSDLRVGGELGAQRIAERASAVTMDQEDDALAGAERAIQERGGHR